MSIFELAERYPNNNRALRRFDHELPSQQGRAWRQRVGRGRRLPVGAYDAWSTRGRLRSGTHSVGVLE